MNDEREQIISVINILSTGRRKQSVSLMIVCSHYAQNIFVGMVPWVPLTELN
jgi:hypothetical protein